MNCTPAMKGPPLYSHSLGSAQSQRKRHVELELMREYLCRIKAQNLRTCILTAKSALMLSGM